MKLTRIAADCHQLETAYGDLVFFSGSEPVAMAPNPGTPKRVREICQGDTTRISKWMSHANLSQDFSELEIVSVDWMHSCINPSLDSWVFLYSALVGPEGEPPRPYLFETHEQAVAFARYYRGTKSGEKVLTAETGEPVPFHIRDVVALTKVEQPGMAPYYVQ